MINFKNSNCCALCIYFQDSGRGYANSSLGVCEFDDTDVWTHNTCEKFKADIDLISEFGDE